MSIECAFHGFLARDADARISQAGKPWVRLSIGVGKDDAVQWVQVAVFGKAAEKAAELKKSDRCYIEGTIKLDRWTGTDGAERHGLSVAAFKCEPTHRIGRNNRIKKRKIKSLDWCLPQAMAPSSTTKSRFEIGDGAIMSTETTGEDLPEIRVEAYDKIDHWREKLDQTAKLEKRNVFERAAADLFLEAEYERDLGAVQALYDAVYVLGRDHAALGDDDIQFAMVGAKAKAEQPINACVTTQSAGGKNALEAFPLRAFENVRIQTERRNYLVKGLLANSGLAVIWGPPKCGKSFWAFDLGMHIALGWDYRGHKVQQATVVYVALEGRHGFPARVEAFRRHHNVDNAPFYLLTASLDLVAKSGQLIAAIKDQLGENLPGALFLDTLNRSLVGSESKDEDMARFLAAAERVAYELSCAVVIVHHCGIDASRPRGHTSLSGAVESQLKVERCNSGEVFVTVELAKDFAEGTEIVSRLERVELGADADGDPMTSLVVLPVEGPIQRRAVTRKLSPRQYLALAALDECAASSGTPAPANLDLPARTVVVQLNAWREELYRKGVLDRDAKSPREEFKRIRTQLQARSLIGVKCELVWKA